jgi:hypothetical protein
MVYGSWRRAGWGRNELEECNNNRVQILQDMTVTFLATAMPTTTLVPIGPPA